LERLKYSLGIEVARSKHGIFISQRKYILDLLNENASNAEAEFRAMAHGVCETLWLKILLKELGFDSKDSIRLYCDNKVTISIAHNPVQHDQTKHLANDRHFIKEKLQGVICTRQENLQIS
jgi:hypothetical protein